MRRRQCLYMSEHMKFSLTIYYRFRVEIRYKFSKRKQSPKNASHFYTSFTLANA